MKTIKYLFPAAVMALASTACSNQAVDDSLVAGKTEICYSTGASRVTGSSFDEGEQIQVYANYMANNQATTYIADQILTCRNGDWVANTPYYWPVQNALDFYAISPTLQQCAAMANDVTFTGGPNPRSTFKLNDIYCKLDFLAACTRSVACPQTSPVNLHFRHMLSRLALEVENQCVYGIPLDIRIDYVKVDFDMLTEGVVDWSVPEMNGVGTSEQKTYERNNISVGANKTASLSEFLLVPQQMKNMRVRVGWTTLVSGQPAESYSVESNYANSLQLRSNGSRTLKFLLRLKNTGTNEGELLIQ